MVDSVVFIAIMIASGLIGIVLFILYIKDIRRDIVGTILIIFGISMFIVSLGIRIYSNKQGTDNIKKAINDNYSNVKNILIQHDPNTKNDKGYFASGNENYSFEVIDNTLVIKQDKTIVKYISGDNY